MFRIERICFTNSGIRQIRIMMTRQTMARHHDQLALMPTDAKPLCSVRMIHDTRSYSGSRIFTVLLPAGAGGPAQVRTLTSGAVPAPGIYLFGPIDGQGPPGRPPAAPARGRARRGSTGDTGAG